MWITGQVYSGTQYLPKSITPSSERAAPPHPLVFGGDDELLVLLGHHAAAAVGRLQHVDHQDVGQHVQLLHIVPRHVHRARQALPVCTRVRIL